MERTTGESYELVMRDGLRGKTAGTVETRGIKTPGAADESARRQSAAVGGHEEVGGVAEASLSQWRVIRVRPSLKIADGGRK